MLPAPQSPPPPSHAALELARGLFEREPQGEAGEAAVIAASERLCTTVLDGLSRWFGPYGSLALVARALTRAQAWHPSLGAVAVSSRTSSCLVGLGDGARLHGTVAVADGVVGMLAALSEIIARLIGEDLAHSLLEQSTRSSTTSAASAMARAASPDVPVAEQGTTGVAHDHSPDDHSPPDTGAAGDAHLRVNES